MIIIITKFQDPDILVLGNGDSDNNWDNIIIREDSPKVVKAMVAFQICLLFNKSRNQTLQKHIIIIYTLYPILQSCGIAWAK